jgi:hypothetical protein
MALDLEGKRIDMLPGAQSPSESWLAAPRAIELEGIAADRNRHVLLGILSPNARA